VNWLALIAGVLSMLAFLAHSIGGAMELRYVAPIDASPKAEEVRFQLINAWHWVSVDLLLATIAFLLVAATELPDERSVLALLSLYFALLGVVWLATTSFTSRLRPKVMLRLGQWLLCFALSALAWFAR
jgi:hypothetical protein